jgi:hypothetical protein
MIGSLLAAVLAAATACQPLEEAEALWRSPETRWVLIGEVHGTNEVPEAFTTLVCLAAARRGPITVVIEWPVETQPILDAWLASDGGKRAKAALLAAPEWRHEEQAGLTSIGVLRMLERLRVLHKQGKVTAVRAFDKAADGSDTRDRNLALAERLLEIGREAKGLTLVLVGNVHASRVPIVWPDEVVRPTGHLLPPNQLVTVGITSPGGSKWGRAATRGAASTRTRSVPRDRRASPGTASPTGGSTSPGSWGCR